MFQSDFIFSSKIPTQTHVVTNLKIYTRNTDHTTRNKAQVLIENNILNSVPKCSIMLCCLSTDIFDTVKRFLSIVFFEYFTFLIFMISSVALNSTSTGHR